MDPGTLVVAALLYVAAKTGDKTADAVVDAGKNLATAVFRRIGRRADGDPSFDLDEVTIQRDGTLIIRRNSEAIRKIDAQIRRLVEKDAEFRDELNQLRDEFEKLARASDEWRDIQRADAEVRHAVRKTAREPEPEGARKPVREGRTVNEVLGRVVAIGQQTTEVRDQQASLVETLEQLRAEIQEATQGSALGSETAGAAENALNQAEAAVYAVGQLQAAIELWLGHHAD